MRIKLITNRDTINYFKEKFYYLLFKNGNYNSGIIQTIQQKIKKMNTMDLLSTWWIIGILKTRSNKHNHNSHKSKFHQPNRWKNDRGNKWKNKSERLYTKSRSTDKTTTIMASTPPHSNRRKSGRSHHNLNTAHAYSV